MPDGLWVQKDAPQLVRDSLRRSGIPPEIVRADLPDGWTKRKQLAVTVVGGGTPDARRGVTRENVEVRVRGADRNQVRKLLSQIDAYLSTPMAAGWQMQISPASGLAVVPDSKLGGHVGLAVYQVTTSRGKIK